MRVASSTQSKLFQPEHKTAQLVGIALVDLQVVDWGACSEVRVSLVGVGLIVAVVVAVACSGVRVSLVGMGFIVVEASPGFRLGTPVIVS